MERPIAYHLLRKEELIYEVEIRDATPGSTNDELRVQIRDLARDIPADEIAETTRDANAELDVIANKLSELSTSLNEKTLSFKTLNKLRAIAHHVFHRFSRVLDSEPTKNKKSEINLKLNQILTILDARYKTFKTSAQKAQVRLQCGCSSEKAIERLKLKYDGRSCIRTFLLRLEELCETRNISEQRLFQGAAELFVDDALTWYRSVKPSLMDWSSLKSLLLKEYSQIDFDDRLLREIRERTQGTDESVSLYIAVMHNYFNLLTNQIPEEEKVKIIRFNLKPQISSALALEEFSSTSDLKEKCKLVEYNLSRAADYKEPSKANKSTLAPDLAYRPFKSNTLPRVEAIDSRTVFCVRCRISGHTLTQCPSKELVCFSCGNKGFTRTNCPICIKEASSRVANPKN
ncbi:retrotransposon gag protein domain-containing protein [Phthorimaea operculella]|nr:retrotransposon gag protein domain-containing protein [Phthorimaea operculella]